MHLVKKAVSSVIDGVLYKVLDEKTKKKIADSLTDQQKAVIRKIIGKGRKHTNQQYIKQIKRHLYNYGFIHKAYEDLKEIYETTDDQHLKSLAAWELAQWHANEYTKADSRKAIDYLKFLSKQETNLEQQRRYAILSAECFDQLGARDSARRILLKTLKQKEHPDIYLGLANLEDSPEDKLYWMNQAIKQYDLIPIQFNQHGENITYDDLENVSLGSAVQGPKISVILPAYNAEDGIQTAIESIQNQTWRNLELIVVDDQSQDGTVEVVKQYMEKDPRIQLLQTPVNSGPYIARNIGLRAATGEFVTINDADDWSHVQKLEIQANHLIKHKNVVANTSEHARLTEELNFYRRGNPGRYIFPNMSSIMFRRDLVLKEIGYWDSVRFAADGEFKRRLIRTFGRSRYVDLKTGPLSLPRQSVTSLTGSSAFGYNGFFMGVRKEYVESLEHYQRNGHSLYYPYPLQVRPFPVPEPMWPQREDKQGGSREFDLVIATDFRLIEEYDIGWNSLIRELMNTNYRIGLVQMYEFDYETKQEVPSTIRQLLYNPQVHMLVYGENISTDYLIIENEHVLTEWQKYVPTIKAQQIQVLGEVDYRKNDHLVTYFGKPGTFVNKESTRIDRLVTSLLT